MMRRLLSMAAAFFCLIGLAGCTVRRSPLSGNRILLNTLVVITLYDCDDVNVLNGCFERISELEQRFSRTREDSEIARLNRREIDTVSDDTAFLIQRSLALSRLTNGRFDITVAPLSELWNFSAESPQKPSDEDIHTALSHVGYQKVTIKGNRVTFTDDETQLDLGAVAKGYIADQVKAYLESQGVKSAVINLGGNVLCVGQQTDGKPFAVGVQDPNGERGDCLMTFTVSDRSVVTSGVYERCFEQDEILYHHILDPHTGYPVQNDTAAVTVISDRSIDGDLFSTALMVMNESDGRKLVEETDGLEAIWVRKDGTVIRSSGINKYLSENTEGNT